MKTKSNKKQMTTARYVQLLVYLAKANKKKKYLRTNPNAIPKLTAQLNNIVTKLQNLNIDTSPKTFQKLYDQYIKVERNLLYAKQSQAQTPQQKEYWKEKRSWISKSRRIDKRKKKLPQKRTVHTSSTISKQDYIKNVLWYEVQFLMTKKGGNHSQSEAEEIAWKEAVASGKIVDLKQNLDTGVDWGYIDLDAKEVISPI